MITLRKLSCHGLDTLINAYFNEFKDLLLPFVLQIFNSILRSGFYPTSWSVALVVSVFKKGITKDPKNYRGISLIDCFAKLFTSILNKRLIDWSKEYGVLSDAQYGFRKGMRTVDPIFSLYAIINKSLES